MVELSQSELKAVRPKCQAPPFSIEILNKRRQCDGCWPNDDPEHILSLLPASYREGTGNLIAAGHNIMTCAEKELDLERLSSVHEWLWVAGLPLPPRALHHQLLLGREIFITEQMDMHLVWTTGRMFLKPLPRFLLDTNFWMKYLSCGGEFTCCLDRDTLPFTQQECKGGVLRQCALGFLFSYAALISHESDFHIAKQKHLLPMEVEWTAWRTLVAELETKNIYPYIDKRFIHGELRLSRLNKIYALTKTPLRGYMARWDQYGAFFHDHFTWLASGTLYCAIVLSAMQVGLGTNALGNSRAFQSASYGFTVFCMFAPLIAACIILGLFCCIFLLNWANALKRKKARYAEVGHLEQSTNST